MKVITKLIPIVTVFVATFLIVFLLDTHQAKKYIQFSSYQQGHVRIEYQEHKHLDTSTIKKILKLAKNHHMLLQKVNYDNDSADIRNIYLSLDTPQELYEFLNKQFSLKEVRNHSHTSQSFISTYHHNNDNQMALIPDFLENHHYNYYLFDQLLVNQENIYGEYIVYYHNNDDFDTFYSELQEIVGKQTNSYLQYQNLQSYIVITIFISIFVLMLFYFIFQIYEVYDRSEYIGCMKLLGYRDSKMSYFLIRNRMVQYIIFCIVLLIFLLLWIKNMTTSDFVFLLFFHIMLLMITYLIHYFCVKMVSHGYQLSNLLKKENIAIKISKISIKLKFVTAILFIVILSVFFQNLWPLYSELIVYKNSKELLRYGTIASLHTDRKELYEYEKHSNLYENIVNNKQLHTFYAEFSSYRKMNEEEQAISLSMEENGTYFRYASVDKNYLDMEKIKIYDMNHNHVDLKQIKGIFFLFPKSEQHKIKAFQNFYEKYSETDYKKYNIKDEFQAYLYENQTLNSYRLDLDNKYVNTPILRVIDESLRISYIESPLGINIFGTSLDTGLKIEVSNNKKETFQILKQDIQKAGLENLIGMDSFVFYKDYFEREIKLSQTIIYVAIAVFLILLSVYTVISIQVISLYVKSENKKVIIQYLLGFEKEKIFSKVIQKNTIYNVIALVLSGMILIILGSFNLIFYVVSAIIFFIIDMILLFTIIKSYQFSNIYLQLKGGTYD